MKKMKVLALILVLALVATLFTACGKKEDVYPSKDLTLIVPWNAGGASDLIGRLLVAGMEPERFCLCLMTLLETGLLQSPSGKVFSAMRSQIAGKAVAVHRGAAGGCTRA